MNEQKNISHSLLNFSFSAFALGWGMVILYVMFNSLGALALKNQVQKLGLSNFSSAHSVIAFFISLFSSWQTWLAIFSVAIATLAWIIALAHLELSKAYPVAIGFNLIIIVSMSLLRFEEPITLTKIVGSCLIFAGVMTIVR